LYHRRVPREKGVPLLLLGGGGYTISNVARCWTYETAVALGCEIPLNIPTHDPYIDYYLPDMSLNVDRTNRKNENTPAYVDYLKTYFSVALRELPARPSVPLGGSSLPSITKAFEKHEVVCAKYPEPTLSVSQCTDEEFREWFPIEKSIALRTLTYERRPKRFSRSTGNKLYSTSSLARHLSTPLLARMF
jgi:hypothetical protein